MDIDRTRRLVEAIVAEAEILSARINSAGHQRDPVLLGMAVAWVNVNCESLLESLKLAANQVEEL